MTRLPTQPQVKGMGQSLASVFRHLNVDYPTNNHWKIILKESPVNQAQFCYLFVLLSCKENQYFIYVYYAVAGVIFSVF